MQKMKDAGVVLMLDLLADVTILLFCAACVIDITCEALENAVLSLTRE